MMNRKDLHLIGYASGMGGPRPFPNSSDGPLVLQRSAHFASLKNFGMTLHWENILKPSSEPVKDKLDLIKVQCQKLADETSSLVKEKKFFIVMGGDHTAAIGTWSGVKSALQTQALGLIWIDAHLDSHTPKTTQTGNIHGMPLACLLNEGDISLTHLKVSVPKIKPEHLCIIGARSFEPAEEALLKKRNVRIFYMDEVKKRGIMAVARDALQIVTQGTAYFGISLDIDSIDPTEAPGVDVPEPNGISADDICNALAFFSGDPALIGAEIVEFDPHEDKDHKTEKLIMRLTAAIALGKLIA